MKAPRFTILAIAGLLCSTSAYAWDSVGRPTGRSFPQHVLVRFFSETHPKSTTGGLQFSMRTVKDALGTVVGAGDFPEDSGRLMTCSQAFLTSRSIQDCFPARSADLTDTQWGWLSLRRRWDVQRDSEHYLIAIEAARLAGLLDRSTVFEPFWIRYPGPDAFIASAQNVSENAPDQDEPDPGSRLVVGQRWLPLGPGLDRTHVTRGISLLELAQLPDFSNSLADWAAGNELCPVDNLQGIFNGVTTTNACHDFSLAMGALNATHFAPLNREMHRYYHGLAITRMQGCHSLVPLLEQIYLISRPDMPYPLDTEVHECEREAFAYEMIAQHYLQDAWSTGHMWKRWGYPRITDFPATFKAFPWQDDEVYAPENDVQRRTAISTVVALMSGMIHGAKSVLLSKLREKSDRAAEIVDGTGMIDDPLCGPTYSIPTLLPPHVATKHIEWVEGDERFHGAGDLFWDHFGKPSVKSDTEFDEQRSRMLACTAASMVEVYEAGPHASDRAGAPAFVVPDALQGVVPEGDECWDHWATNESMFAATGPVNVPHAASLVVLDPLGILENVANDFLASGRADTISFPNTEDESKFRERLRERLPMDRLAVNEYYAAAQETDPTGTQAARWLPIGQLRPPKLLDTGPPADPVGDPPLPPGVDYVDQPLAPGTEVADDELGQLAVAVPRMFWRGNLQNTCIESLRTGAETLNNLRSQCIQSAATGGDPDACTECVAIAELHIPRCYRFGALDGLPASVPSKCQLVGVDGASGAGLPAWWFDQQVRTNGSDERDDEAYCGWPSSDVARLWCTDTQSGGLFGPSDAPGSDVALVGHADVEAPVETQTIQCPGLSTAHFFRHHYRVASIFTSIPGEGGSPWATSPFFAPMERAYQETYETELSPEPCSAFGSRLKREFDSRREAAVAPAQFWDNEPYGVSAYRSNAVAPPRDASVSDLAFPYCGATQRVSTWNRSCHEAAGILEIPDIAPGLIDPDTGEYQAPYTIGGQPACFVREARRFQRSCLHDGLTCTSSGECVGGFRTEPEVVGLDVGRPPRP